MSEPDDDLEEIDDEEPVVVTLKDEDGDEQTFQLLQVLEVDGKRYGVLASLDEEEITSNGTGPAADKEEEESDLIVLRMSEENGEEYFEEIEDDAEFRKVVEVLERLTESEEVNSGVARQG